MIKVLFVCMGNICRSPMAEGVFRRLVAQAGLHQRVEVDSAGTGLWHVGKPPDPRARQAIQARGGDIHSLRARQVVSSDLVYFDYILAMDKDNLHSLYRLSRPQDQEKIKLFLDFAPACPDTEVPDPYFGGEQGFEVVLDLIEQAAKGLFEEITQTHLHP